MSMSRSPGQRAQRRINRTGINRTGSGTTERNIVLYERQKLMERIAPWHWMVTL